MKKPDVTGDERDAGPGSEGATSRPDPAETAVGAGGLPLELSEGAVKRLEEELAEVRDRYVRLAAEYDNFRKRIAKERVELGDRAQAALVIKLLEVLDDLDRVERGSTLNENDVVQQALVLIERKLRKELEAAGLERLDPVGAPFDPSVHEAVSVVPAHDGAQDHTVSATFQAGYRFKGSLIRPARVQVFSNEGHV
jgi:molecular chaperone GrpE